MEGWVGMRVEGEGLVELGGGARGLDGEEEWGGEEGER